MELLKQRILQDGRCYPGGILKVDSFINHQMDPMLMYKIAEEFIRRFQDRKINNRDHRGERYRSGHYGGLYHAVAGGLRKEEETEDDGEYALYRGPFLHEGS